MAAENENSGGSPSEDVFINDSGRELTRKQIVYSGWHEGGVEQTEDGFLIDGELFTPVDAEGGDEQSG